MYFSVLALLGRKEIRRPLRALVLVIFAVTQCFWSLGILLIILRHLRRIWKSMVPTSYLFSATTLVMPIALNARRWKTSVSFRF